MNDIKIFENEEFGEVRVIDQNSEPWFIAKDVCEGLLLSNVGEACKSLKDNEKNTIKLNDSIQKGNPNRIIVSESGLYKLIMQSRKKEAIIFKNWIAEKVLPSIRKHEAYMTPDTIEKALINPDFIIKLATQIKEEQKKRKEVEDKNNLLMHDRKSYSISEIAKELGLRSAQQLNKMLADDGIIFKNKRGKWLPYADFSSEGYFEVKDTIINDIPIHHLKVTQKGRVFILNEYYS